MFESCSAYQSAMEILYLAHCTPDRPDKGEKIRAYHQLQSLARRHDVHLACFARTAQEVAAAGELGNICPSVHIEKVSPAARLLPSGLGFLAGRSLTGGIFSGRGFRKHVRRLAASRMLGATVAYSTVMGVHAPPPVPLILDMVDVDSEKWMAYAASRVPGFLFAAEGRRLRALESSLGARSRCVFLSTVRESNLYRGIAPDARVLTMENGVDTAYFDPSLPLPAAGPRGAFVFVGAMDYFPNVEAVRWFASAVLPSLRERRPGAEFVIVGRNPKPAVTALGRINGVTVTGSVPDVRPYLAAAAAVVAPLRIARGIQNKVLEALAMGKRVLVSPAISETLGPELPTGVTVCGEVADYCTALASLPVGPAPADRVIREGVRRRYCWEDNMERLDAELGAIQGRRA